MKQLNVNDLLWFGRNIDFDGIRYFNFSSSGFEFCFKGKSCTCTLYSDAQYFDDAHKGVVGIYTYELKDENEYAKKFFWDTFDESSFKRVILENDETNVSLFESSEEKVVVVKVIKISEVNFGAAGIKNIAIDGNQIKKEKCFTETKKIEYIGDSITCGYGIEGVWEKDTYTTKQQRADKSYAFLTAQKLSAEFMMCSWSGIGIISKYVDPSINIPDVEVVMPSIWPYTDKSFSLRKKIEPEVWDSNKYSPDILIINLGTNDASFVRGVEERRIAYVSGMRQLIEAVHRRSPKAKICCCLGVMGQDLCDSMEEALKLFKNDFPSVETKYVKFPVQDEKDGIAADWHPSAVTHEKMSVQLSEALKDWM